MIQFLNQFLGHLQIIGIDYVNHCLFMDCLALYSSLIFMIMFLKEICSEASSILFYLLSLVLARVFVKELVFLLG